MPGPARGGRTSAAAVATRSPMRPRDFVSPAAQSAAGGHADGDRVEDRSDQQVVVIDDLAFGAPADAGDGRHLEGVGAGGVEHAGDDGGAAT